MQLWEAYIILNNPSCYSKEQVEEAKKLVKFIKINNL